MCTSLSNCARTRSRSGRRDELYCEKPTCCACRGSSKNSSCIRLGSSSPSPTRLAAQARRTRTPLVPPDGLTGGACRPRWGRGSASIRRRPPSYPVTSYRYRHRPHHDICPEGGKWHCGYCSAAIFLGVAAATGRNLRNQHLQLAHPSHSSRILLLSHRRMCRVVAAGARGVRRSPVTQVQAQVVQVRFWGDVCAICCTLTHSRRTCRRAARDECARRH